MNHNLNQKRDNQSKFYEQPILQDVDILSRKCIYDRYPLQIPDCCVITPTTTNNCQQEFNSYTSRCYEDCNQKTVSADDKYAQVNFVSF